MSQESDPEPVFRFKQDALGNEIDFKGIPKPSVERNLESPEPEVIDVEALPTPTPTPTTNPGLTALSPEDKQYFLAYIKEVVPQTMLLEQINKRDAIRMAAEKWNQMTEN